MSLRATCFGSVIRILCTQNCIEGSLEGRILRAHEGVSSLTRVWAEMLRSPEDNAVRTPLSQKSESYLFGISHDPDFS